MTDSFEEWWKTICLAKYDQKLQKRMELTVYLLWYVYVWRLDVCGILKEGKGRQ